jgi:hypothetical protein
MAAVSMDTAPKRASATRWMLLSLIGTLGGVAYFISTLETASERNTRLLEQIRSQPQRPVVTMSEYNNLQAGITLQQAKSIVGDAGKESVRSDIAGINTVIQMWQNADGSNMNATFQNDSLVLKAQFGLP